MSDRRAALLDIDQIRAGESTKTADLIVQLINMI